MSDSIEPVMQPSHWNTTASGWTQYHEDGSFDLIDHPKDDVLVFDVETMYKESPYAVMATARSLTCWYSWLSPWLLGETSVIEQLIPVGPSRNPRLIIGHNVGYDRARITEEYRLQNQQMRFLDTMSLHAACHGLSSPQRSAWLAYRKNKLAKQTDQAAEGDGQDLSRGELPSLVDSSFGTTWQDVSAVNSLVEVARLHCGIEVDKSQRNAFGECNREEILSQVNELLSYCARDVQITQSVFTKVWPKFVRNCPSAVTLSGILQMSVSFLPVDESWNTFLDQAESVYNSMKDGVTNTLHQLAEETRQLMYHKNADGSYLWERDPWLSQLDWSPKTARREITSQIKDTLNVQVRGATSASHKNEFTSAPSQFSFWNLRPDVRCRISPLLLKTTWRTYPVCYDYDYGFCFRADLKMGKHHPKRVVASRFQTKVREGIYQISKGFHDKKSVSRVEDLLASDMQASVDAGILDLHGLNPAALDFHRQLHTILEEKFAEYMHLSDSEKSSDPWLSHIAPFLPENFGGPNLSNTAVPSTSNASETHDSARIWPQWFWAIDRRPTAVEKHGEGIDLSIRSKIAPLLLKLTWHGHPLFHSRQHGWLFRIPLGSSTKGLGIEESNSGSLAFDLASDIHLKDDEGHAYYKLPHHDGTDLNVGSPLSKGFVPAFEDGRLGSNEAGVKEALDMNSQCSYWLAARERVINQMVVKADSASPNSSLQSSLILPQVITMGTVTRRAVENTWLTASNAKKNRVGSELKSLVKAPPGYAIVGADVDSEELWICSVMGDSYFGFHGATAIGWMTLEGSKSEGTDMHSVTAKLLGISRDGAKVFNYSRIYGAGVKHAVELLKKSNPALTTEEATVLAKNLYANTKGTKLHSSEANIFKRKFWFGGTESYVFNMLEGIAMSSDPRTPALNCGITSALRKEMLPKSEKSKAGEDFLPSRINWVVQSSGVDYLHMLIVAMRYLCAAYQIDARYMISVHDEIRYLVAVEDKYRAALALQIANMWTRSAFAHALGMNNLPQSCAFFSAVDIDHVWRKEVGMPCITPSSPTPISPGEAVDIYGCLEKTAASLWPDQQSMARAVSTPSSGLESATLSDVRFLEAQAVQTKPELLSLLKDWKQQHKSSSFTSWHYSDP